MKKNSFLPPLVCYYCFKWQYMTRAGVGAGAEIRDKGGAGAGVRPKINNFGSTTLVLY